MLAEIFPTPEKADAPAVLFIVSPPVKVARADFCVVAPLGNPSIFEKKTAVPAAPVPDA